MRITSLDFENNTSIPLEFTGDGKNINPSIEILEPPKNTQSFVLVIDDPDANSWVHWLVFNISPKITKINKNSVPGIQGKNSWNKNNYMGPTPPSGTHRYFFRVYALDIRLDLNEGVTIKQVENAIRSHILEESELIGLYTRRLI